VAAAERGAPDRDGVRADAVERAREPQRGAPVLELAADVEQLARLAARIAEVAVREGASAANPAAAKRSA